MEAKALYSMDNRPKMTHAEANYTDQSMKKTHCSICAHWKAPDSCQIVESPIEPGGGCDYYEPR